MKTSRLRRTLLWLQGCIVFFLLVLFAAGVFYDHVLTKIESNLAAHPTSEFDRKLATKIGQPFTRELHGKLVEISTLGDEALANVSNASHKLSRAALNISGLAIFMSLFSIFIVVRNLRDANHQEKGLRGSAGGEEGEGG